MLVFHYRGKGTEHIYIVQIVLVKKNECSATVVKARYPKSNNLKLTFEGLQPLNRARFYEKILLPIQIDWTLNLKWVYSCTVIYRCTVVCINLQPHFISLFCFQTCIFLKWSWTICSPGFLNVCTLDIGQLAFSCSLSEVPFSFLLRYFIKHKKALNTEHKGYQQHTTMGTMHVSVQFSFIYID